MIKIGIVAAGSIVQDFLSDMAHVRGAEVSSLYSRTLERARAVCSRFQIPHCSSSLEELFTRCEAVYIASPNSAHFEQARQALLAGKHVLCEKPICTTLGQYALLEELAQKQGLILMEAQRMAAMGSFLKLKALVQGGMLGDVYSFEASLGTQGRRLDRRTLPLGGGATMDLGVYPLFAFTELFGLPSRTAAFARFYETGVDAYAGVQLSTETVEGHLSVSFTAETRGEIRIMGTKGTASLPREFTEIKEVLHCPYGQPSQLIPCPQLDLGLASMTNDFLAYVRGERLEGYKARQKASRNVLTLTDEIRKQIGLAYPCDREI